MSVPLLLVAHGSTDPRFADVVEAVADGVRRLEPGLEVRVGYLEHGPPTVADAASADAVAVPLLLSSGYHVLRDLPAQARGLRVATAVGPDPLLATALADRLRAAGYDGKSPVTLAAAGSADPGSLADVRTAAEQLAAVLGVGVQAAFIAGGSPGLDEIRPRVVASYLLAPGAFHDRLSSYGAQVLSAPIGAHPLVAHLCLERYRAQVPGRIAPA